VNEEQKIFGVGYALKKAGCCCASRLPYRFGRLARTHDTTHGGIVSRLRIPAHCDIILKFTGSLSANASNVMGPGERE
jgi:hypothetical protein